MLHKGGARKYYKSLFSKQYSFHFRKVLSLLGNSWSSTLSYWLWALNLGNYCSLSMASLWSLIIEHEFDRQRPLSKQFHYTQAPNSLHLSSIILHLPPNSFIPQRRSTKFHSFLHCPSSFSTFNHQFHDIHIHSKCARALFDERLNQWWGVWWMKATRTSSFSKVFT